MQPEKEGARRALRWVSEQRSENPEADMHSLIDQAGRKFDLNPLEQEALITWLAEERSKKSE